MRISHRRNKRLLAILSFELALLVCLGFVLDNAARPAISGTGPLDVYGFVTDSAGTPIPNADVTVTVLSTMAVRTCSTASDGSYQVAFLTSDWNSGDTVQVVVVYNTVQEIRTGVADDLGNMWIDVQFSFEIPEFGSVMGSMVAIAAVAFVAVLFIWKRPR